MLGLSIQLYVKSRSWHSSLIETIKSKSMPLPVGEGDTSENTIKPAIQRKYVNPINHEP